MISFFSFAGAISDGSRLPFSRNRIVTIYSTGQKREKQCRVSEISVNMKYLLVCSVVALLVLTVSRPLPLFIVPSNDENVILITPLVLLTLSSFSLFAIQFLEHTYT